MVRGVEIKKEKRKEAIEEIIKIVEVKIDIKKIKRLGKDIKTGKETILVKLENEEQKRKIWKKKSALKGGREKIQEDLMVREG